MTGNEGAQKLLKVHEEIASLRHHNDLLEVMSLPAGRRFVWELLEHAGTFGPSYANEALATAFNEGRRSVGIGLMIRCQSEAPDLYVTSINEQLAERRKAEELRKAAEAEAAHNQEEND